jgi:hypothetical protein
MPNRRSHSLRQAGKSNVSEPFSHSKVSSGFLIGAAEGEHQVDYSNGG